MITLLPEKRVKGKRLGRHRQHDPRSRSFETPYASKPLISAKWERHCPIYDQGDVGSCTGNAMAGALMTGPLWRVGRMLTEDDALQLYEAATHIDRIPGHFPPDDTGSSGLAVAHAAKLAGMVNGYHHAFSHHAALASLGRGPAIIGIGWYEGFDAPIGQHAELRISGDLRGGHEVCLVGIDVEEKMVEGVNSWGEGWGNKGHFTMSFGTLDWLLSEDGDCTVFT